jgi:hypothetical protein
MISRYLSPIAGCAVVLALVGCGSGGKPAVVPAGGKVMFNKTTPAVGALVVFHPVDPALSKRVGGNPFAKVRDDGTFVLTTFAEGDGAPEGEYGVTIDWRPAAKDQKLSLGDGGATGSAKLNPKYGNPQQPVLKATVKTGDPNQFTFDVD